MAPPPVTHIKWTLVINPDEVKCWLAVVRPFLDMLAGLSDFAGYQLYRSIDKAHHFMLEMTFLADKASVQEALECPLYEAYKEACRTLVAARETAVWAEGELPAGTGEHRGWTLVEEK